MSYDRILVAIDTSSLGGIVFEQALEIAQLHTAKLYLLHCVETSIKRSSLLTASPKGTSKSAGYFTPYDDADLQFAQQKWEAQIEQANEWLLEYYQHATQQGVPVTCEAVFGEPGYQICALANEWQVDVIAMGRQGHSGLAELFLGSVSNYVLHHAPCSVLVVQGNAT
ncbi:universal stress protein [Acaryochloris sp. IP29b_bin.137]|uniref:universal stress protein n=1 Tax=Acaryochloris sp. IP29b_bin.137 TaxID=2969217 RepID=UPI002621F5E8|nr:universal stress protein [Acaryochloris sp. IP29b_bin.137]